MTKTSIAIQVGCLSICTLKSKVIHSHRYESGNYTQTYHRSSKANKSKLVPVHSILDIFFQILKRQCSVNVPVLSSIIKHILRQQNTQKIQFVFLWVERSAPNYDEKVFTSSIISPQCQLLKFPYIWLFI